MYGCGSLLLGSHDGLILATAETTIVANGNGGVTLNSSAGPITVNGYGLVTIESDAGSVVIAANATSKQLSTYSKDKTNISSCASVNITACGTGGISLTSYNVDGVIKLQSASTITLITGTQTLTLSNGAGAGGGVLMRGLAPPEETTDAANKEYVDSLVVGLNFKPSCRVNAPTGASPLNAGSNATYASGAGTISLNTPGSLTAIDGVTVVVGDRVLVTQLSTTGLFVPSGPGLSSGAHPEAAGIYTVTSITAGVLTRASDCDTPGEMSSAYTYVEEGTLFKNKAYVQTYTIADFSTDAQHWVVFSASDGGADIAHIGPTTLGANGSSVNTGISTMASVRAITNSTYNQNFAAGGLILESDVITKDSTATGPRFGPALYMSSPNAIGLGLKGVHRLVTCSTGNGDIYSEPNARLSFQKFASIPPLTITSINASSITLANAVSSVTAVGLKIGDEIMFSGANGATTSWVGETFDPTVVYYIKTISGSIITVSSTIGGSAETAGSNTTVPNGVIYLWTEISSINT